MTGVVTVSARWLADIEQTMSDLVGLMEATDLGPEWDRKVIAAIERAHDLLDQDTAVQA